MDIPNLDYFRSISIPDFPDFGAKMVQSLQSIATQATNVEQQTNSNPKGQPTAPPQINKVEVSGRDGVLSVSITDNNPIYRGIKYYAEHADNPQFTNSITVPMVDSRNVTIPVGSQKRYVRAYSAYSSSPASPPVYHGGAMPEPVAGGGATPGPLFLPSQGSGTGLAGQGLQGPGDVPFRSPNGLPPIR